MKKWNTVVANALGFEGIEVNGEVKAFSDITEPGVYFVEESPKKPIGADIVEDPEKNIRLGRHVVNGLLLYPAGIWV